MRYSQFQSKSCHFSYFAFYDINLMYNNRSSPNYLTFQNSYSRIRDSLYIDSGSISKAAFTLQQDFLAIEDQKRYFQTRLQQSEKDAVCEQQALLRRISEKNELIVILEQRICRFEKQLRLKEQQVHDLLQSQANSQLRHEQATNKLKASHQLALQQLKDQLTRKFEMETAETLRRHKNSSQSQINSLKEQVASMKDRFRTSQNQLKQLHQQYRELASKKDMEMRHVLNIELKTKMIQEQQRYQQDFALREALRNQNSSLEKQLVALQQQLNEATAKLKSQNQQNMELKKLQQLTKTSQSKWVKTGPIEQEKKQVQRLKIEQNKQVMQADDAEPRGERVVLIPVNNQKKLVQSICGIAHLSRKSLADLLSRMYSRSQTQDSKKKNSLGVFINLLKGLRQHQTGAILQLSFIYSKLKQVLAAFAPDQSKAMLANPVLALGAYRTQINDFLITTVKQIMFKFQSEKKEQNRFFNKAYRLLQLRQRVAHPTLKGGYEIDLDLRVYLQDMLVESTSQLFQ